MEGVQVVNGRPTKCTADTLHLSDVAMATTFWLSMGYNFGCVIASGTIFGSRVGWVFEVRLFDGKHFLVFYIWGMHIGEYD